MDMQSLIIASMLLPLVGAFVISRLDAKPNAREAATLVCATLLLGIVAALYQSDGANSGLDFTVATLVPGLSIAFSIDKFGMLFALVASSLWIVTSIYAIGYMRSHHEKNQTRFFTLFAVAISAVMAICWADNLFTLFLFYEVLTLSTYPLVTHAGTEKARRSGRVYLGILMGSSIGLFLFGVMLVWHYAGNLDFTQGGVLAGNMPEYLVLPVYLLFLLGIGKAAVMPMHKWLPAAMVAPTPVSALLHAVAVVKAGVFSLLKVTLLIFGNDFLTESGANIWLLWLPVLTILLASLIAMSKDNLKERLAYSTISQLSYIVLGILLANEMGVFGSSLHIVMHAFAKISLFFAAGAILVTTHKTQISQLSGLGKQMPITFTVFLIGSLSIVGLPPFGGLWSKWYLAQGSLALTNAETMSLVVLGTLMLSSLLNIAYLVVIPIKGFFGKAAEPVEGIKEAPLPCLIGLCIPAAMCLYLFFYPQPFVSLLGH